MHSLSHLSRFNGILSRISYALPGTYYGIVRHELSGTTLILDVACGSGIPMRTFNRDHRYRVTGVDLFDEYLNEAKQSGVYDKIVKSDIRELPFPNRSFDVVIALHIIEHLEKDEGWSFARQLERIAKKKVIIATPIGFLQQDGYDDNLLQEHKSGWEPEEFHAMGYRVIGQGWNVFHGDRWLARVFQRSRLLGIVRDLLTLIAQPYLRRHPRRCFQMICVKDIA